MRLRPLLVSLVVPLLAAGARAEEAPAVTAPEVRSEDIRHRIRWLADDERGGRDTTSEGGRAAARWIAEEFRRFGLLEKGTRGYFQDYTVPLPVLGEGNELVVAGPDGERSFVVEKDWNPFSVSPSGEASAPLVFAGFGMTVPERDHDDYAGVDANGKVVLVLRRTPGWEDQSAATFVNKLATAAEHGAVALLLCNDAKTAKEEGDLVGHWSAAIGAPAGSGRIPFAFVSRETASCLLAPLGRTLDDLDEGIRREGPKPAEVPGVTVRLRTAISRTADANASNLVGFLPGGDPAVADEVVLVGAHYDHIGTGRFGSLAGAKGSGTVHNGADDNGSGTAVLLELAEWFAVPANRPRRSLLFVAFSGEEMGLLGSLHYAESPTVPLADIVTMVNMDMVGRCREGRLDVGGVGTGTGLQDLVAEANREHGFSISWDFQGEAPTDSTSFFRRRVPVLWFFTGMHGDYHRPSDDWDRIDCDITTKVAGLVRDTVRALADREERVVYTEPPELPRPPMIGIRPSPEEDARGLAVGEVVAGGPAEAAGVEPGDLIVTLADQPIRGFQDLFRVLARLEAGKSVRMQVLRDGETVTLDVVPAERPGRGRRP
jgi:hypothetical protein